MEEITNEPSKIAIFRKKWLKKGVELINITTLCDFKLGCSGWCNNFNEPEETFHHIQCWYRNENIAIFNDDNSYVIEDDKYLLYIDEDFIIFRKVKIR